MQPLRPNTRRAKNAIALIWVVMGISIIVLFYEIIYYYLAQQGISLRSEADGDNLFYKLIYIVGTFSTVSYGMIYILSAITFIMWFRRACYNLEQRTFLFPYSNGWAVGAWFTPLYNLYVPYRMMKNLYVEANELLSNNLRTYNFYLPVSTIGYWWFLWILVSVFNSINRSMYDISISLIGSLLFIPLSIVTVKVIKNYAEAEIILAEIAADDIYNIEEGEK